MGEGGMTNCRPDHPRFNDVAGLERACFSAAARRNKQQYAATLTALRAAGHQAAADDLDRIVATPAPTKEK